MGLVGVGIWNVCDERLIALGLVMSVLFAVLSASSLEKVGSREQGRATIRIG